MVSSAQNNLLSAALAPMQIGQQIDFSVALKTLNAQKQDGDAALQLLDGAAKSAQAGLQPGDPLVAKATGLGSLLDISA